jgi:ribosomal protein S8
MTPKVKRKWVKEEKQIVYLLYRKGFLKDFKVSDFYWAEYRLKKRKTYKTKTNRYDGKRYRFSIYMPEVHYSTTD